MQQIRHWLFRSKMSSEESGECVNPGASVTVPFGGRDQSGVVLRPLVGFLQLSCWGRTWATQAFLKNVGICWLYPLVIVLFCLDDLKAKFLVEVNCRLVADLHVTAETQKRKRNHVTLAQRRLLSNYSVINFPAETCNYVVTWVSTLNIMWMRHRWRFHDK